MIDEEKIKKACTDMVIASYRENFQRNITEEEIAGVFKYLIPRMEDDLKNLRSFSDAEFDRYMNSKRNELLFSPQNIHSELRRVLIESGENALAHAGKYKRLREMEVATRVCFANRKLRDEMLMILPQDNPDIILALMGSGIGKNVPASRLEVMTIPEITKDTLGEDLPNAIAKFIQEKKFTKDYGGDCSLVVCLDFTQLALNFDRIAEAIQKAENNPYQGIWLTFVSSEDGKTTTVAQVFPSFVRIDYNLEKEPGLIY